MPGRFAASAAVAALLLGCGLASAQEREAGPPVSSITVEGQASRDVAPDQAYVSVGVASDRPSAAATAAANSQAAAVMIDEIKSAGIAESDIATQQASLSPVYETDRSGASGTKVKGFHAANVVRVRVRDLKLLGPLLGRLLDKGANTLEGVDYSISDPDPVLDQLRTEATRDARRKAQIFADAAGVKLGHILNIVPEGGAQPPPFPAPARMKLASAMEPAPMPLQPGTESLQAQVRITWELAQ